MPKPTTLNRFPLFDLFAHQAARHIGYPRRPRVGRMMTEKLNSPIQEEFAFSAAARPYGPGGGGKREGRLDAVRLAFQSLLHRRGVGGGKATLDSFSFRVYGLAQRSSITAQG